MTTLPIRVMIVDDHAMIRRGLKAYFMGRTDVTCVGEASDGEEALNTLAAFLPDVVLLDVNMPRVGGIEAAAQIRQRHPGVKVIMLTSVQEQEIAATALQIGASGYLLKDIDEEDLVAAIRFAHAGHVLFPPGLATQPNLPEPQAAPRAMSPYDLSHREKQVLALIVAGLSNKEISHRLSLSLSTAKFHVSNLITKLGASSRTEATAIAIHAGLVDAE